MRGRQRLKAKGRGRQKQAIEHAYILRIEGFYVDLVRRVPFGTQGDELPPPRTICRNLFGFISVDVHFCQIFF